MYVHIENRDMKKKLRTPIVQTRRDAWVEINLGHIEHNVKELKKLTEENTKFLAVVKADAYGHDATMVSQTLEASGVDMLGVASVDEGHQLRSIGITKPILVLGSIPNWSFVSAVENDLTISIFTQEHLESCISTYKRTGKKLKVHIKVDTGMNRIGISSNHAVEFIEKVKKTVDVNLDGLFTHLACAESPQLTKVQSSKWQNILSALDTKSLNCHVVNTAGLISYKDLHSDMVRAGIGIYGLMPDLSIGNNELPGLKQVMGLKARIAHVHSIEEGQGVSYGYSFIADKNTKIATLPMGYADGIPRGLSNQIHGIINGQKIKQIGNITMDQTMFDVTELEDVKQGDIITLLGHDGNEFISIDSWAKSLNTISYEITCGLKVRLPRVYTR